MEFIDALEPIEDQTESGDTSRSIRQRMIAAQIRDSEIGESESVAVDVDNFDASVENKVFANESTLMEMDEIITQIQHWRTTLTQDSANNNDSPTVEGYRSAAYDRLFQGEQSERPECEEAGTQITAHIDDIDMVAKLKSLQSLISESKSAVSMLAHQQHVSQYAALVDLLKTKFGAKLSALEDDSDSESDNDSNSSDGDQPRVSGTRDSALPRPHRSNNDEERWSSSNRPSSAASYTATLAMQHNQAEFQAIDLELKQRLYGQTREKEDEVIRDGADLHEAVLSLQNTLRDFTGDLDRLLQS